MPDRLGALPAGPVLILTPTGRDAEGAAKLLAAEGIGSHVCPTLADLQDELDEAAGAILVADEALIRQDLSALAAKLAAQPPWSDIPFVVLTQAGLTARRQMAELNLPAKLGNMLVLERPLNALGLVSAVKSSLRARQRQRQVRAYLLKQAGDAERVAAELEARVQERTAALEAAEAERRTIAEALAQAQKMEAVGQLTGGLAHDFNNMLTGITGSLELMDMRLKRGETDRLSRYVQLAQESARRAAALTHRLLAYSRRQTLDPRPTNANALVEGMMELIGRTIGPGITIETVLTEPLWLIRSDPHQLENALLNLCINARDAMPDAGALVIATRNEHIAARSAAGMTDGKPGDYVTLSVRDNGAGMPPDVLGRVFEPFFTTKPIGEGTGLGLSMIYGFVRQSQGDVRIESAVGQGTTVRLYLPRYDGPDEAARIETSVQRTRPTPQATVLVVDDEPTIRLLVTETLADLGLTTLEAENGEAGLRLLRATPSVCLLVTDVGMPGMNGHQLALAARREIPSLKVLMITGYEDRTWSESYNLEHGVQVMTKPFELDALVRRVQSMIIEA